MEEHEKSTSEEAKDPFIPSEILINAKNHLKANRNCLTSSSIKDYSHCDVCPKCGLPIDNTPLKLFCKIDDLKKFGIAFYLYFKMGQTIFCLMLIGSIMAIPIMAINSANEGGLGGDVNTWPSTLSSRINDASGWMVIIYTLFFALIFNVLVMCRKSIYKTAGSFKVSDKNPSSYTVMVTNVPDGIDDNEFKKAIEDDVFEKSKQKVEVKDVCYGYQIDQFIKDCINYHKCVNILTKRGEKNVKKLWIFRRTNEELKKMMEDYKKKIDEQKYNNFEKRNSFAFVTFKTIAQKIIVKKHYKLTPWQKFKNLLKYLCCCFTFCYLCRKNTSLARGSLKVRSSPAPSDIIWQNLSLSTFERFLRQSIGSLVSTILSIICNMLVLSLQFEKSMIKNNQSSDSGGLTIFISLLIIGFNMLISKALDFCANFECHISYTDLTISKMKKKLYYTTGNTIISLLITFLFDMMHGNYLNENSKLPGTITAWVFMEAVVTPFLLIFDPWYLWKVYRRRLMEKGKLKAGQDSAYDIFTNPQFDISDRSVKYIRLIGVILTFSAYFTFGFLFSLIPITTYYWTDKILFLRRYSRSNELGKKISLHILKYLEDNCLKYLYGSIIFFSLCLKRSDIYYIFIPVFLYVFLMFFWCCCKGKICNILELPNNYAKKFKYENCSQQEYIPEKFEITYRTTNPVHKKFIIDKRQKTEEMIAFERGDKELNEIVMNLYKYAVNAKDDAKMAEEISTKIEKEEEMESRVIS